MNQRTLSVPEDSIINILKALPKNILVDIFWKTLIEVEISPLSQEERQEVRKAKREFEKGETIKWKNIK